MNTYQLKLEALKLAYEVAFKIGISKIDLEEDLEDVFKIAEMNFEYLTNEDGEQPLEERPTSLIPLIRHPINGE